MYEENCTILKKDRDDRITFLSYETFLFPEASNRVHIITFSTRIKRSNGSKNFTHFQSFKVIGMLMFIQFSYQKVPRFFSSYILHEQSFLFNTIQ